MKPEKRAIDIIRDLGAIEYGHYRFSSGRHSTSYVNHRLLVTRTDVCHELCLRIVDYFEQSDDLAIGGVIGPEYGGAKIAVHVATILTVCCDKRALTFSARTAQSDKISATETNLLKERQVLLVDDVFTTGGTLRATKRAVEQAGGTVAAVAVILNRSEKRLDTVFPDLGRNRTLELGWQPMTSWPANECRLCANNVPLNTDLGHPHG